MATEFKSKMLYNIVPEEQIVSGPCNGEGEEVDVDGDEEEADHDDGQDDEDHDARNEVGRDAGNRPVFVRLHCQADQELIL